MEFEWQKVSQSPGLFSVFWPIPKVLKFVSTHTLISQSSSNFTNPLVTVPKAPITINIFVTFIFHSFWISMQVPGIYHSFCLLSTLLCDHPGQQSPQFYKFSFFVIIKSCSLAKIRWFVCISKSQSSLCVSFCRTDSSLCIYHLFVWSNLNSMHCS